MNIYIVILNWNGHKDTIPCLESLLPTLNNHASVIICDNASIDNSIDAITAWRLNNYPNISYLTLNGEDVFNGVKADGEKFIFVLNKRNLGFAGGNNPGIQLALNDPKCEYVWLLNNDTTVDANSLSNAIDRMESDPEIGICGSSLVYHHTPDRMQAFGGSTYSPFTGRSKHIGFNKSIGDIPTDPQEVEKNLDMVVGAAMLVRRSFIEHVGLMQEDYFLYYEEIDWATRGRHKFKLGYAPKSLVWHKEGASIGTDASGGSPLSVYYLFRNRVLFTWRFYPLYLPSVLLFAAMDLAKFFVKGRWPQFLAGVRGLLHLSLPPKKI